MNQYWTCRVQSLLPVKQKGSHGQQRPCLHQVVPHCTKKKKGIQFCSKDIYLAARKQPENQPLGVKRIYYVRILIIFWVGTKLIRCQIHALVQFEIKLATECVKACFVCTSHHLEWKWPQICSGYTFQTRSPFPAQFRWVWQECLELSGEQISKGQRVLTWGAVWLRWRHIFPFHLWKSLLWISWAH